MPSYPTDAACGRSRLPASTWDNEVAGETDKERGLRLNAAAAVCVGCPVMDKCYMRRTDGGGIRAGVALPDKVPGWTLKSSNEWLGWSARNIDLHGNEAGYKRHLRDDTRVCTSCLAWLRRDAKDDYGRAA